MIEQIVNLHKILGLRRDLLKITIIHLWVYISALLNLSQSVYFCLFSVALLQGLAACVLMCFEVSWEVWRGMTIWQTMSLEIKSGLLSPCGLTFLHAKLSSPLDFQKWSSFVSYLSAMIFITLFPDTNINNKLHGRWGGFWHSTETLGLKAFGDFSAEH